MRSAERLRKAIEDLAGGAGELLAHEERSWASITFSGTRHKLTYGFDGVDAVEKGEKLVSLLPEHEFAIPGQLVADAAVVRVDHSLVRTNMIVDLELLLLEED